jgi:hypothetical protein
MLSDGTKQCVIGRTRRALTEGLWPSIRAVALSLEADEVELLVWSDPPPSRDLFDRFEAYVMAVVADECLEYGRLAPYGFSITYLAPTDPFTTDADIVYRRPPADSDEDSRDSL